MGPDLTEVVSPAIPFAIEAIRMCSFFSSFHSCYRQLKVHRHLHGQWPAVLISERMELTTVMKDTRMVSRFARVQQRVF